MRANVVLCIKPFLPPIQTEVQNNPHLISEVKFVSSPPFCVTCDHMTSSAEYRNFQKGRRANVKRLH